MKLQCNVVSHWPGAYTKWSLYLKNITCLRSSQDHWIHQANRPQDQPASQFNIKTSLQVQWFPLWRSGPRLNIKNVFPGVGISIIKIRRSWDRLILIMGIPILVRWHLYTGMGPWQLWDHLMFIMGIPVFVRRHLDIELTLRSPSQQPSQLSFWRLGAKFCTSSAPTHRICNNFALSHPYYLWHIHPTWRLIKMFVTSDLLELNSHDMSHHKKADDNITIFYNRFFLFWYGLMIIFFFLSW